MTLSRSITAVLLAGGLGTRLRTAVSDRPKAMASIAGRPFLTYLLEQLEHAGIRRAVLCVGYLGDQVQACFGDTYHTLRLAYSQESMPLGTAGALRLALPLIDTEDVLVLNGDSYCEADLSAFANWHREHQARASLLLTCVADTQRYGQVQLQADGEVAAFNEKKAGSRPGWVNAGVYMISRVMLAELPPGQALSLEHEVFPTWVGHGLYGWAGGGRFVDIGTPEAYMLAQTFFAQPSVGEQHLTTLL